MDRKFEPVMTSGATSSLPPRRCAATAVDSSRVLRNTYWLLALSMLPTVAGAFVGMQLNFIALFKAAPIMTPLLMFGAMIGSLFVVTRLRNSAWGVRRAVRLHVHRRRDADADPDGRRAASATAGSWSRWPAA